MRRSCSYCHYTNLKRIGDITVGDQWGIPKDSLYEDDKGLSLILVNSEKGKALLENSEIQTDAISLQECMQPQLRKPSQLHPLHQQFVKEYETKGFVFVAKKYSDMGIRYKINKVIEHTKDFIRPLLKK